MSKPKTKPKKRRATFTDGNAPIPATMAVDAAPRAGDPPRVMCALNLTTPGRIGAKTPDDADIIYHDEEEET